MRKTNGVIAAVVAIAASISPLWNASQDKGVAASATQPYAPQVRMVQAVPAVSTQSATGTTLSTVSETKTIISSKCYKTHRVTKTYYSYSKTKGWTKYPAPKVTTTDSTTCH